MNTQKKQEIVLHALDWAKAALLDIPESVKVEVIVTTEGSPDLKGIAVRGDETVRFEPSH